MKRASSIGFGIAVMSAFAGILLQPRAAAAAGEDERAPPSGQANPPVTAARQVAWMVVRATAGSIARQPFSNGRIGFAMLLQRAVTAVRGSMRTRDRPADPGLPAPGTERFEELLDREELPARSIGTLELLVDGQAFFTAFEEEVRAAKHSIDIQVYIFDNDDIGVRCADLLRERAGEIPVRVIFDDFGTTMAHSIAPRQPPPPDFTAPEHMGEYLAEGSIIPVRRTTNPWLVLDHTKLLIFDRETAFLGGMNLGREYRSEWHDMMFRVRGPLVHALQPEFEIAWERVGPWGDLEALDADRPEAAPPAGMPQPDGAIPLRPLRTDVSEGRFEIYTAAITAIRAARRRVWIECPYHGNDPLLDELVAAAKRGVDVRLIIPEHGNYAAIAADNLSTARVLIEAGARVYVHPGMSHLKAMIVDDWANIGTSNYDTNSLLINRELNIAFSDRAAVAELEARVFAPDFERSRLMKHEETRTSLAWLIETLTDQL